MMGSFNEVTLALTLYVALTLTLTLALTRTLTHPRLALCRHLQLPAHAPITYNTPSGP